MIRVSARRGHPPSRSGRAAIYLSTSLSVLFALQLVCNPAVAGDLDTVISFNIASESLDKALLDLGTQAHVQVMFAPSEETASQRVQELRGLYTTRQALEILLKGTRLVFASRGKTVEIRSVDADSHGAATLDPPYAPHSVQSQSPVGLSNPVGRQGGSSSNNTSAQTDRAPSKRENDLQEVIVTAEKVKEREIDVPISMSVVTSHYLSNIGALQFSDWANAIPGVQFTTAGTGFTFISIRGVTNGADISSTTAMYVDGVPIGPSTSFSGNGGFLTLDLSLFDINRIEVLRGPQGTLWGATAMGGLIRYVTEAPSTTQFGGQMRAGTSYTHEGKINHDVAGAVNIPLKPHVLALRVSAYESHDGGYINNVALNQHDVDHSDIYGGRVDVLVTPTDALNVRASGLIQDISRSGDPTVDYSLSGVPLYGELSQYRLYPEPYHEHFGLLDGTVTYAFGPATLSSITGYQTINEEAQFDVSAAYVPLFNSIFGPTYSAIGYVATNGVTRVTQELRLNSENTKAYSWVGGVFYNHESYSPGDYQAFLLRDLSGLPLPNTLFTYNTPAVFDEYAAYGDFTLRLSQKLDLTGGLRYAVDDVSFQQIGSGLLGASVPHKSSTEHDITSLADARYHLSNDATLYARYATGYRPGGPNDVTVSAITHLPNGPPMFESDNLKDYELGVKAQSIGNRFSANVDVYDIEWSNMQVSTVVGGFSGTVNASGGARIQGVELSGTGRPVDTLAITGSFAYQHGYMKEAETDLGAAQGERLPNVPRITADLNADYSFRVGSLMPTLGGTVRYVSDRFGSFDGSTSYPQYHLPSYAQVDLRAAILLGRTNIQLYAHNILDKRSQFSDVLPQFGQEIAVSRPRTIGLNATVAF